MSDPPAAVRIPADSVVLEGLLGVPSRASGIVLFAHGSGSSRLSPRNTYVARELRQAGIGTLLFDLLTADESEDRALVFDVELLARRLRAATEWTRRQPATKALPIGYFGASTGAAAALIAAADDPTIAAVVSRGGRPDLAGRALPTVQAPTLLIVGGDDVPVIAMNENASRRLRCERRLAIIPGATHLFEEPGTLAQVVRLATGWFRDHFRQESGEKGDDDARSEEAEGVSRREPRAVRGAIAPDGVHRAGGRRGGAHSRA
jgi:dienelactone hydrolase